MAWIQLRVQPLPVGRLQLCLETLRKPRSTMQCMAHLVSSGMGWHYKQCFNSTSRRQFREAEKTPQLTWEPLSSRSASGKQVAAQSLSRCFRLLRSSGWWISLPTSVTSVKHCALSTSSCCWPWSRWWRTRRPKNRRKKQPMWWKRSMNKPWNTWTTRKIRRLSHLRRRIWKPQRLRQLLLL